MDKMRINIEMDDDGRVKGLLKKHIVTQEFTTKDGEEVKKKVMAIDIVKKKEPRVFQFPGGIGKVTHFAAFPSAKQDDGEYEPTIFVGEGIQYENTETEESDDVLDGPF